MYHRTLMNNVSFQYDGPGRLPDVITHLSDNVCTLGMEAP